MDSPTYFGCFGPRPTALLLTLALLTWVLPVHANAVSTDPAPVCYVVADNASGAGSDNGAQSDALFQGNPRSGAEQLIGSTGTDDIEAIAYHIGSATLFGADQDQVGTINLTTGRFTALPHRVGEGEGAEGRLRLDDVDGMAVDQDRGILFGSIRRLGQADLLIQIDRTTGKVVPGAFGSHRDYVVIDPVNGLLDIDDLAYHGGTLYGIANNRGRDDRLVRIDPSNGQTSDIGRVAGSSGSPDLHNFEAFTSMLDGTLIGIRGSDSGEVFAIDPRNARATQLSTFTSGSDYEAATCTVPIDSPRGADLALQKTVSDENPTEGTGVRFTITVTNEGTERVTGIEATDRLPSGLTYASSHASQGAYNPASGLWRIGELRPGAQVRLEIVTRVDTRQPVTNTAEITRADQADRDSTPGNGRADEDDQDSVTITPTAHGINLCIQKWVDDPAAHTGDEVTFTIRVCNDPDDFTNVVVVDQLPFGLTFRHLNVVDKGTASYDPGTHAVTWNIPSLPFGETATLEITTRVDATHSIENCAEITESTPPENKADNHACAAVTPGQSSGGGDAGVESDGNLATKLARRLFHRRQDAHMQQALRAAPEPAPFDAQTTAAYADGAAGKASGMDLTYLVPAEGPQNSVAQTVTPDDLLGITNATSVFAVDYVRPEGRRLAALFGATSPNGVLYDHAKNTCDRLAGGHMESVRSLDVDGNRFIVSRIVHRDGSTDYAVSFVAYDMGTYYAIDSRFSQPQYEVPAGAADVINLQVWSVAPEFTASLIRDVLDRLRTRSEVVFLNGPDAPPTAPDVFVHSGEVENGILSLRIVNRGSARTVVVKGTVARTEHEAEEQIRTPFEQLVTLPEAAQDGEPIAVAVPLGAVFDAVVEVEHAESGSHDKLYYADGVWSYTQGEQARVDTFETFAAPAAEGTGGQYIVGRPARMTGEVTDWASLFRYLRPGGQPVDLSAYRYVEVTASGRGMVWMVLEKGSVDTWDQYGYAFRLTAKPQTFRIRFDQFVRSGNDYGFTAEDVTLAAFYVVSDGSTTVPFNIHVEQISFGGALSVDSEDEADLPSAIALDQNYPNPFNPTTQIDFTLDAATPVRLAVYDVLGREVALLMDGLLPAGTHTAPFSAANLPSGTYLYRLETPAQTLTRMMVLMK